MSEVINTNVEKLFFAKIMEEPNQFYKVEPKFFENEQIKFVYDVIRTEYLESKNKIVPSAKQIWSMVSLQDSAKMIQPEAFKAIMSSTTDGVTEEWLDARFKAWKASKHSRQKMYESIELLRGMDDMNHDNVMAIVSRLKDNFNEIDTVTNDDEDLGGDFDDPEEHRISINHRKMSSGWSNIDRILGGGWDRSTFNVLMGETNVGKCVFSDSIISVRSKKTGEISQIKIGDLFDKIKSCK